MEHTDELVLDYLTIRHRIERHLTGIRATIVHIILFLVGVIAALYFYTNVQPQIIHPADGQFYLVRETLVPTEVGVAFTVWSLALLIPGLLAYRNWRRRPQAIETELSERLGRADTDLFSNPRRMFRVQSLLDDDLHQRSGIILPLLAFLGFNAVFWVLWLMTGGATSATWQLVPGIILLTVFPTLLIHAWNRRRRERRISRQIASWETASVPTKSKRGRDVAEEEAVGRERAYRLSDDGELIEADPDDYPKAKRA